MIVAVVGRNGAGKTAGAVALFAVDSWLRGRPVVANFRLYPERLGFPKRFYRPLYSYSDVARLGRHNVEQCLEHGDTVSCPEGCEEPKTEVPRLTADGELWSVTNNEGCA